MVEVNNSRTGQQKRNEGRRNFSWLGVVGGGSGCGRQRHEAHHPHNQNWKSLI